MNDSGQPFLLLDGGDAFGNPDALNSLDDMLMGEYLFKGMDLCGQDVMNIGEAEFRFGETFLAERLAETNFAVTSANVVRQSDGLPYATRYFTTTVGDISIGIIGVLFEVVKEEVEEASSIDGVAVTVDPVASSLAAAEAEMGQVDLLIVMAHMHTSTARDLAAQLPQADVVIVSHGNAAPNAEETVGGVLVHTGYDGRWIGHLGLTLDDAGKVSEYTWDPVPLDASWPDDPVLAALYQEYLDRLETEAENIVNQIPQETPDGGSYVGDEQCQSCHPVQASQWATTEHAGAFTTLVNTNHDYSPSCFPCHTTGFGFVGGFLLPDMTPTMEHVQCESCHGAAEEHLALPVAGWSPPATTQCADCHTPEHSPDFDMATYLPQVAH